MDNVGLNYQELVNSLFFSDKTSVNRQPETSPQNSVEKVDEVPINNSIEKIDGIALDKTTKETNSNNATVVSTGINYTDLRKKAKQNNFSEFNELSQDEYEKLSKSDKKIYDSIVSLKTNYTEKQNKKENKSDQKEYESAKKITTQTRNTDNPTSALTYSTISNNIKNDQSVLKYIPKLESGDIETAAYDNIKTTDLSSKFRNTDTTSAPIALPFQIYTPDNYLTSDIQEVYKYNINARLNTKRAIPKSINRQSFSIEDRMIPMGSDNVSIVKQENSPPIMVSPRPKNVDNLNLIYKKQPIWRQKFG